MGKYQSFDRVKREERPWQIHPIWRGIGCIMILLILVMAYAATDLSIKSNILPLPPEMNNGLHVPAVIHIPYINFNIPTFWEGTIQYRFMFYYAIFVVLGFGLLTVIYSILYRFIGPPRYSQIDAGPMRTHRRR